MHDATYQEVPAGVDYYSSSDEEWFEHFCSMTQGAVATVVLTSGPVDLGGSFRRELESLRTSRLTDRVIVVCPPVLGPAPHGRKAEVFRELSWPVPSSMPIVAYRTGAGEFRFHPSLGARDDSLADRYANALDAAFTAVIDSQS